MSLGEHMVLCILGSKVLYMKIFASQFKSKYCMAQRGLCCDCDFNGRLDATFYTFSMRSLGVEELGSDSNCAISEATKITMPVRALVVDD